MSSLFNDGCGCSGKTESANTKCKGCVCELLAQLDDRRVSDFCTNGGRQRLLIKNKGAAQPVSLDGTGVPTEFTLENFDRDNCCAVFSFEMMTGTSPVTTVRRTFIEDCRSIAGIACLGEEGTTGTL
ncbi:hypothetical protein EV207_1288 [Scopulibacillus darangshiensis]|uniref:Spore coat protein Z n=1 Tax=Scopulibacillus darangshiensis TaxID=442528 RepID=A0A4R2NR26_9BACL|nr:hypothetical protein [Scopulibacillus darangshiensis]TCP23785.1 hypothetical protein EV207_1288 [Scopulibacillus darangshiensis]